MLQLATFPFLNILHNPCLLKLRMQQRKNHIMAESAWRLFLFVVVTLFFYATVYDMFYAVLVALTLIGLAEVVWSLLSLLYNVGIWAFFELHKKDDQA